MPFEEFALNVLTDDLGLEAEKIEEGEEETPDFIALDGERVIYIELKEKSSSDEYLQEREAAFDSGELYSRSSSIERCRNISKTIHKAKRQLNSVADGEEFRFVWLHADGREKELLVERFICTLFGKAEIYDLGEARRVRKDCYYFDHSDFFKYREQLDGAIISFNDQIRFAINNHSPKYEDVLSSGFVQSVGEDYLIDAIQMEQQGKIWTADCDLDRRNEDAILAYIKEKYSLGNPRRIIMHECVVEFAMPDASRRVKHHQPTQVLP
jgi:hypothetical protein